MATILVLAPAANMIFASLPSGSTYVSDANGLVRITNGSMADQAALVAAGCAALLPLSVGATQTTLAALYAADVSTPFAQGTYAIVFADGTSGNNGLWQKTGTGNGAGNWTEIASYTVAALQALVNANTAAIAAETARAIAAEGAETTRALAAEAAIVTSVSAETTRALAAEAALAGDFAPLSAALATIETVLATAIFNTARFCIGGTPPGTVDAATTAALPAFLYDSETGAGDQLVELGVAALASQDGVAMSAGKRLLVKNQSGAGSNGAFANGIYVLTQQGDGSTLPWILTRASDAYQAAQLGGIECAVNGGTLNAGTVWLLPLAAASIVVGTTQLNFVALSTAGNLVVTGPDRWDSASAGSLALTSVNRCIAADPTAGAVNLTLPSTHQNIFLKDKTRRASVATPINVSPDAGSTIEGNAGPFVIAVPGAGFAFKFDTQNNDWSVFG